MSLILRPSLTMIGFKRSGSCFVFILNYTSHHSDLFLLVQFAGRESRHSLICVEGTKKEEGWLWHVMISEYLLCARPNAKSS